MTEPMPLIIGQDVTEQNVSLLLGVKLNEHYDIPSQIRKQKFSISKEIVYIDNLCQKPLL
jgi:hypothetical protein